LAHHSFTNGDVAFHQKNATPMMAWSPLAGGNLFNGQNDAVTAALDAIARDRGVDVSAVAVAWLLAHPSKILPVMGTNNLSRISRLSDACDVKLDRQEWYEIYIAALGHEVP
jgi:predicted oxidoreductase